MYTLAVQPERVGGAVERDGLENRCTFAGTGGSNPSPSAAPQYRNHTCILLHLGQRFFHLLVYLLPRHARILYVLVKTYLSRLVDFLKDEKRKRMWDIRCNKSALLP